MTEKIDPNKPVTFADIMAMAENVPAQGSGSEDPYEQVRASFAAEFQLPQGMGAFSYAGPTETSEGWKRIGSVFVNPALGPQGVLFPTKANGVNPAEVEGSEEWLQSIQEKWSDDKFDVWRKRLLDLGYEVASKGGLAQDVIDGLRTYHINRYLNGGKAIPLRPGGAQSDIDVRDFFDKKALKLETKTWGNDVFGEELDDDEAEFFADRVLQVAQRLARKKGDKWTPTQITEGAKMRVYQDEFAKDPMVKDAAEEAEELEGDLTMRNNLISVSQLSSI